VLALRPRLDRLLDRSLAAVPTADDAWVARHRPAARLSMSVEVATDRPLALLGDRLRDWTLHRRAGLRVRADGPVRPGGTVALAVPLGPRGTLWATAPCRVTAVYDEPDRAGFRYATLPGHPERGVEEFVFERGPDGVRFTVEAVSVPALWQRRVPPYDAVQRAVTRRYLAAATVLGAV
jgi:uncharacterized protein (UPF0548 family)